MLALSLMKSPLWILRLWLCLLCTACHLAPFSPQITCVLNWDSLTPQDQSQWICNVEPDRFISQYEPFTKFSVTPFIFNDMKTFILLNKQCSNHCQMFKNLFIGWPIRFILLLPYILHIKTCPQKIHIYLALLKQTISQLLCLNSKKPTTTESIILLNTGLNLLFQVWQSSSCGS